MRSEYRESNRKRAFLKNWGAEIALTLRAIDKGALNPTVSGDNLPGIFTFAGGGHLGANATREMAMTYFIPFSELLADPARGPAGNEEQCDVNVSDPIAGNLKIDETLAAGLSTWDGPYTLSESIANGSTWNTITHHVIFDIEMSASATPTWTIARLTVNPTDSLISAERNSTNELLITFGPAVLEGKKLISAPSVTLSDAFSISRLRTVRIQQ